MANLLKIFSGLTPVMVILLITSFPARASQIYVPSGFQTIQAAIHSAEEGDEIVVTPGIYSENIRYLGKNILVRSTDPNDMGVVASTIIDGHGAGRVVTFRDEEGSGAVLAGFTLQNGHALSGNYGGGIYCFRTSPTIRHCTIKNSQAIWGAGICFYLSSATISHCTINDNSADLNGGGIICQSSSPTITNCNLSENIAVLDGGGIYCYQNSSPTISHCTISNNSTGQDGGGICCYQNCLPTISHCKVNNNSANWGGGITCWENSPATISNCLISGNLADSGGGITCHQNSSAIIRHCTITGNSANLSGGIYYHFSSPRITNCILWHDSPDEVATSLGSPSLTYSNIQGGYEGEGNINADPLFVNPNEMDYYLQPNSPCIDAGINEGTISDDIDGLTRPKDGDEDGLAAFDLGAFEYVFIPPPTPSSSPHKKTSSTYLFSPYLQNNFYSQLRAYLLTPYDYHSFSTHQYLPYFYDVFFQTYPAAIDFKSMFSPDLQWQLFHLPKTWDYTLSQKIWHWFSFMGY